MESQKLNPATLAHALINESIANARGLQPLFTILDEKYSIQLAQAFSKGCIACSVKLWKQKTHQNIKKYIISQNYKARAHKKCEKYFAFVRLHAAHKQWHDIID